MELPEQDRQALIEAARKRGQGGAAFGVYPSSGKRPEKLNVSRDVNMPAQAGRGWVAGTLGLLGDFEGIGRTLLNMSPAGQEHERVTGKSFVSETPFFPTSEFYQEWLPGRDERPAAKFASGLGALAGGAGSTKVAGAALKGAKATGKALGPTAAGMAESYLQKSGLAPSVVKPKGGNWLSGSVESATQPLKRGVVDEAAVRRLMGDEFADERLADPIDNAVNNWIDTKLNKYIRNEMGTPEDPVRKLAERDILHVAPEQLNFRPEMHGRYLAEGQTAVAQSPTAKTWEGAADLMIAPARAGELLSKDTWLADLPQYRNPLENNPWLEKVSPETSVYALSTEGGRPTVGRDLGFDHLIDELRNATRADSDLPANLRWKPEDLKKVTMEQAVERVAKINEYRAAKKAEANEVLARNPATAPYKDYQTIPGTQEPNQKGLAWKQIRAAEMPEDFVPPERYEIVRPTPSSETLAIRDKETGKYITTGLKSEEQARKHLSETLNKQQLQDALKYEGDVMGHCVGGYCDDVLTGRSQIYSLRDKKGEPHVTIEVHPEPPSQTALLRQPQEVQDEFNRRFDKWRENLDYRPGQSDVFEATDSIWRSMGIPTEMSIVQIKGKGNAAPKAEYLPFVQDFVRSGNWSRVGDFRNTGFDYPATGPQGIFDLGDIQRLNKAGIDVPKYLTRDEAKRLQDKLYEIDTGKNPETGYAKGGLVQDTDAIAAKLVATGMDKDKALTQALRMADAKQEAHMAAGGLAKLLKGAKKAGESAKTAEKAAEAAKPAARVVSESEALQKSKKAGYPMAPKDRWYGEGTYDKSGGRLEMLSPDEFLRKVRPLEIDDASRDNIDYLKQHIKSGGELDPLLITKSGKEDGRHRAHAAKELGITKVPVIRYDKEVPAAPRAEALETARKNAVKMLGLPEDNTAMDRARALGFDTAGFRGSSVEETTHTKPIWWSEDPEYASAYAAHTVRPPKGKPDPYAGNVMPLLVKQGTSKEFERFGPGGVPLDPFKGFNEGVETGLRRYAQNEITGDLGGKIWEGLTVPKNVRSRFAAFDPARVNENDLLGAADPALLAGTAVASGIGLGALGQLNKRKPEKEEKKKATGGLAKRV